MGNQWKKFFSVCATFLLVIGFGFPQNAIAKSVSLSNVSQGKQQAENAASPYLQNSNEPYAALSVSWQTSNTCQWMIDTSGTLIIKPIDGTSGTLANWSGDYAPWYSYASQITSVKVTATVSAQTAERMFYGCTNLKTVDLAGLDTQNVTSMFAMFYNCSSLVSTTEAPLDLSMLNTSKVTSMANMFYGCKAFKTLSLNSFVTINVTDFGYMFDGCTSLESLDVSSFDTSYAKNLASMFSSCASLGKLDINNFEALRATYFSSMFAGCSSLKTLDLSKMNTEDATNMSSMFQNCTSLETLNVADTFNTQSVENMQSMFKGCTSLKTLDLTSFKTPKATTMQAMFQGCSSLVTLDISGFDASKVEYFTSMFQGCSVLEGVNLTGINTSSALSMARMFKGCSSIETLDLSSFNTLKTTNMAFMFESCSGLAKVQLGANFAFEGSTSAALCALPAGKWVNSKNQEFTESEIPSKTADTYTKISKELDFTKFTVDTSAAKYSGNPVVGRISSATYEEGSDYEVEYTNNINAGTATITITGVGTHTGSKTYNFQIEQALLDFSKFTVDTKDVTYTGSAITPAVTVEGYTLNTDYTVTYANNTNVGKASVTVAGVGNYAGSKEYTFEIVAQPYKPSDPDEPEQEEKVTRLAGEASADTAAAIAKEAFPEGVSSGWVVIARDDDFADAMSATGLAGALDAPILLTNRNELSSVTAQTVKDLGATQAYIIGGTGAIPGDLESALKIQANCTVNARVFGTDAWDTSVECAKRIKEHGGNKTSEAIVAMGTNFQDALSISSFAYKYALPLFLETDANNGRCLTADAKAAVREAIGSTGTIYVPGGTGAVPSESVEGEFSGSNIVRMFGENGYDTSNQIATWMLKNNKLDASTICVANGSEAPKGTDALAGAALAGKRGGVILLANTNKSYGDVSRTTIDGTDSKNTPAFLKANVKSISKAFVLGGTSVMPDAFEAEIKDMLK